MDDLIAALKSSHTRLVGLLDGLSDEQAAGPSYDDDWSIGQVASHLGSGAEIFVSFINAGFDGSPAPGQEQMSPIWDRWNAKTAGEQARDVVGVDAAFLELIEGLSPEQRDAWTMDMFGQQRDLRMVLGMRLSEHALHTWDIAVALDPTATIADDAVGLILDGSLPMMAGMVGKPLGSATEVAVTTTAPAQSRRLVLGPDSVALTAEPGDPDGPSLALPAEAFVRLVYGRLDEDHMPADVTASGIELDDIRSAFPGF
jgi:uncharacterized protein (TIGR03083 family)